jgi:hypothetical protein
MKNERYPRNDHQDGRTNQYHDRSPGMYPNKGEKDPEDLESDKWNPTEVAFAAFLDRDFALAQANVAMTMLSTGRPMTVREIKESSLHSIDTIERVLTSKVTSGLVKEDSGRYELVR